MPPGIARTGEHALICTRLARTNIGTGRAAASQGWHRIIPPGMGHLSVAQATSLTRHRLKDITSLLDP